VGREGAALQMAGSVTDTAARLGKLTPDERRTLVAASLAGGWGAVFAVPVTGIVFTLQVVKHRRWQALVPAVIAAYSGKWVVDALGYEMGDRPRLPRNDWTFGLPFKLAVVGIGVGLIARIFVALVKLTKRRMAHLVHWPPGRTVIGGAATVALMLIVGRDYLGLSTQLYSDAIAGNHIDWWDPLLKMVFTVIALGTGFVGGEVLPLFVMGSTFGAATAPAMNMSAPLLAATGAPAAFASAASVTLTGIVLTVEQFGWRTLIPAIIVGVFARMAAGRPGLYMAH
jgi:H+/Cl- antiporter ClcA